MKLKELLEYISTYNKIKIETHIDGTGEVEKKLYWPLTNLFYCLEIVWII